jgi:Arsenate reductase and related proteins, glutaredoxin family
MWKFYHNPNCSKSREALSLLQSKSLDFQLIEYLKTPLSSSELRELIVQLSTPVSSLVRIKEADFISAPFDVYSLEEVVHHLSEKPHLMERPILQGNGRAAIGRPMENIAALLG